MRSSKFDAVSTLAGDVAIRLAVAGILVLVAHVAGTDALGGLASAYTLAALVVFMAEGGVGFGAVQMLSTDVRAAEVVGAALSLRIVTLIAGIAIALALGNLPIFDEDLRRQLALGISLATTQAMLAFLTQLASPFGRFVRPALAQIGVATAITLSGVSGHVFAHNVLVGLRIGVFGCAVFALGWGVALWRSSDAVVHGAVIRKLVRISIPFALSAWLVAVYFKIDVLFLAGHISSATAGVYDLIYKLTSFILLVPAAFSRVFLPKLFRSDAREGVARAGSGVLVGYALVCVAGLTLGSSIVAKVLPADGRAEALQILRWLPLFLIARGALSFWADGITSLGLQKRRTTIQIVAAVLNVTFNIVLIPRHGVMGAVAATLISEAALAVGYGVVAARAGLRGARSMVVIAAGLTSAMVIARIAGQIPSVATAVGLGVVGAVVAIRSLRMLERMQRSTDYVGA